MPVHNAGQYLQTAVNSVLNQHGVDIELVLIDDHSTDSAISDLEPDARIKHISSASLGVGKGIVPALNAGIAAAKFEIIARMDGDDIAHPARLSTQLNFLNQNTDIDISGTTVEMFRDDGDIGDGYRLYQDWINALCSADAIAHNFFVESCIPHPTAMMHRDVLDELGGYHDSVWPEDYDLWCRAHLAGKRFGKPETPALVKWRDHTTRTSRSEQRYSKQRFLQCKAHYLAAQLKQKQQISQATTTNTCPECVIWGTGPTGLKLHDYLEINGIRVTSFVDINQKMRGRSKRNKPVRIVSNEPTAEELRAIKTILVVAVSARGARELIHHTLVSKGLIELEDFILAA